MEQHYPKQNSNSQIVLLEEDIEGLLFITLEFNDVNIVTPTPNVEDVYNII